MPASEYVLTARRAQVVGLVFVLILAVLLVHITLVAPFFGYAGLNYIYHGPGILTLVLLLSIFPSFFLPKLLVKPSDFAIWIIYILAYIPNVLISIISADFVGPTQIAYVFTVFLGMIIIMLRPKPVQWQLIGLSRPVFGFLVVGLIAAIFAMLIMIYGFPTEFLSLTDVYLKRLENREQIQQVSAVYRYLTPPLITVLLPVALLMSLELRSILLTIAFALFFAVIYNMLGSKGVLFTPALMIAFFLFLKLKNQDRLLVMLLLVIIFVLIPYLVDILIFERPTITPFASQRLIILQGVLTGMVQDFFIAHDFYYYSHSFLRPVVDLGHVDDIPEAIGLNYLYRSEITHANVSFFANGYANLGFVGIILASMLLAFLFWLYDSVWSEKSSLIGTSLLALIMISVSNTGIHTVILSNGLGFAILIGLIAPREKCRRKYFGAARISSTTPLRGIKPFIGNDTFAVNSPLPDLHGGPGP